MKWESMKSPRAGQNMVFTHNDGGNKNAGH